MTDAEWAKLEKDSPLVVKWLFIWGITKWICVTAMTVAGIWGFVHLVRP